MTGGATNPQGCNMHGGVAPRANVAAFLPADDVAGNVAGGCRTTMHGTAPPLLRHQLGRDPRGFVGLWLSSLSLTHSLPHLACAQHALPAAHRRGHPASR